MTDMISEHNLAPYYPLQHIPTPRGGRSGGHSILVPGPRPANIMEYRWLRPARQYHQLKLDNITAMLYPGQTATN